AAASATSSRSWRRWTTRAAFRAAFGSPRERPRHRPSNPSPPVGISREAHRAGSEKGRDSTMKIYASRLGMIPSTEIAYLLRIDAERKERALEAERRREARAGARALRRRELWLRVRASLSAVRSLRAAWPLES